MLTETLIEFTKPILTAANGVCLEYGVAIVALSDLTFTSSKVIIPDIKYFNVIQNKVFIELSSKIKRFGLLFCLIYVEIVEPSIILMTFKKRSY